MQACPYIFSKLKSTRLLNFVSITPSSLFRIALLNADCIDIYSIIPSLSLPMQTVRNLHFLSKNSTLISREKLSKKNWVKNSWNWIFGQKFDFSNSVPMISSVLIDALCLYWTLEIKKYCNTILKLLEFYATHFVCSRSISKMRSGIT